MRFLIRALLLLLVLGGIAYGAAYFYAGTLPGPSIDVRSPEKYVGQNTQLEFSVDAPEGLFSQIAATLAQDGQSTPVFSTDPTQQPAGEVSPEAANRLFIIRPIGKQALPDLKSGPAQLTITASRPVLYGIRTATTTVTRDLEVRLDPPRVGVLSLHHFVNHGGPEFVVFRATPADVDAGVRVGEVAYPAFPGSSVGITDPAVRVAFFVLGYDQDRNSPISLFARDVAGNEATASLEHRTFPKPFAKSRIEVDDRFFQRVVPAIAQASPGANIDTSDLLKGFLTINGDLRRKNNETISALAQKTRPEMLWGEAFSQLGNTSIESRFADYRTYIYNGKEVDQQVHLGLRPRLAAAGPGHGLQPRRRALRRHARHLRQLRDPGSRASACRPCTRTCRRWTSSRATRSRRGRRSAAPAPPVSPAAITCTTRCSSTASR